MIYNIQTFCTYGYWPEDLSHGSGRPIIATCDRCGKIRITSKKSHRKLCISCSNKKRYEDPKEREKQSKAGLEYYKNNPMSDGLKERRYKALLEYHKNNYVSEETKEKQSKAQRKRFEDPKERNKASEGTKKHFEDPLEREKARERSLKAYEDDPMIIKRIAESVKRHYDKMDDPGQEIIKHHYIYDFNDLTKYTIQVTRSEHTSIHWNLKRAGLEVPCINIMKVEI